MTRVNWRRLPVTGISPAFIRCAFETIALPSGCRKIVSSRAIGTPAAEIMSLNTVPGPTGGTWTASPTRSKCAPEGTA